MSSILTICLTSSDGLCKSINLLWILISNLSQVFEPSPQGVFLVVILRTLVGSLTGPLTFSLRSLAPLIKSAHTIKKYYYKKPTSWILDMYEKTMSKKNKCNTGKKLKIHEPFSKLFTFLEVRVILILWKLTSSSCSAPFFCAGAGTDWTAAVAILFRFIDSDCK